MPMLKKYRDLEGWHTLFTCKLIRIHDEEAGTSSDEILMPGKVIGNQIPYLVDLYFKMEVNRKGEQVVQTAPSRMAFAKDRSGALDNPEKPDMSLIIRKIQAKINRGN